MGNEHDIVMLNIAATSLRTYVPKVGTLSDRMVTTMSAIRANPGAHLWMGDSSNDDLQLRVALAAVMIESNAEDREIITASIKPLRALNALLSGLPIDMAALADQMAEGKIIPIMRLWERAKP